MSELNDALIEQHSRTLKLPALCREYSGLARQARADSWSYEGHLRVVGRRRYQCRWCSVEQPCHLFNVAKLRHEGAIALDTRPGYVDSCSGSADALRLESRTKGALAVAYAGY